MLEELPDLTPVVCQLINGLILDGLKYREAVGKDTTTAERDAGLIVLAHGGHDGARQVLEWLGLVSKRVHPVTTLGLGLTVDEAADKLDCSTKTIRRMARRGDLLSTYDTDGRLLVEIPADVA